VNGIVETYSVPTGEFDFYSDGAKDLELFALMLCRRGEVDPYIEDFTEGQVACLTRLLSAPLVSSLGSASTQRLLTSAISAEVEPQWNSVGITTLGQLWAKSPPATQEALGHDLLKVVPSRLMPELAHAAPELVPEERLQTAIEDFVQRVHAEVAQAEGGIFSGGTASPMVGLSRLLVAVGQRSSDANQALIAAATSPAASSDQRFSALSALQWIAEARLIETGEAAPAFSAITINAFMSEDLASDQRLDDVSRLALRARLAFDREVAGALLAGGRDSDPRVRQVSVQSIAWRALHAQSPMSTVDALLLGAVYDPDPRVQAAAVPAVWAGTFEDEALRSAALNRLVQSWPQADRRLRVAVAAQLRVSVDPPRVRSMIAQLAAKDRSWQVRWHATHES
jgi:hypothetical protein